MAETTVSAGPDADFAAALDRFSSNPIAQLWLAVQQDVMPLAQAVAQAPRHADAIDEEVVNVACAIADRSGDAEAVALLWIVRAAATSATGSADLLGRLGFVLDGMFATAAGRFLVREADGRLARAAQAVAEHRLEQARAANDGGRLFSALITLGALCSNPIVTAPSRANLKTTLYIKQRQFFERHQRELMNVPEEEWVMPPPAAMLKTAATAYGEAAELSEGPARGRCRKAQASCLIYLEEFDEAVDRQLIAGLAREAASLIDRDEAMADLVSTYAMLAELGEAPSPDELAWLVRDSGDALLARYGADRAVEIAINSMALLRQAAPALGGAAVDRAGPLITSGAHEQQLPTLWEYQLSRDLVARVSDGRERLLAADVAQTPDLVRGWAEAEHWDPAAHASALAWVARQLSEVDGEEQSLQLLDEAEQLAPVWAMEMARPLRGTRMELYLGLAVNAVNSNDLISAIQLYGESMRRAVDLDLTDRPLDVLTRISTLIDNGGAEGAVAALVAVGPNALALENLAGDSATDLVQNVCRHALARLGRVEGSRVAFNPEAVLIAFQVAKGMRFAALLVSAQRFAFDRDRVASGLLSQIAAIEAQVGTEPDDPDRALDDNLLLAASRIESVQGEDDDPYARARALRQAFDRRLHREMLGGAQHFTVLGQRQVEASLDDRTALVELYLGRTPDGNAGLYAVGMTRDEMTAFMIDLNSPDMQVEMSHGGRRLWGSLLTAWVADLRRTLLEPSEPDLVSPAAAEGLRSLASLLPALSSWLDTWSAAGVDHVCFIPHGALHYVPFHLIPHHDEPLAATWRVSTLPNRALLLDSRGEATTGTHRRRQVAAFGMTYADGLHGLTPLRHAGTEAAAVAAVYGTDAQVDQQATETAVRDALRTARFVHIAAHGRHDYDAPSFQCVYLSPDDESDGVLRAHELLTDDLRGTEVVTLSACETALGQFDQADNPRGLPAALLLAGVRCVIGTLWDVRSDTAELFFTTLHADLAAGITALDAFTRAQRTTRAAYPVYRDWGAFTLSGLGLPS